MKKIFFYFTIFNLLLFLSHAQTCQWARKISGNSPNDILSIRLDSSGNIFVAGCYLSDTLYLSDSLYLINCDTVIYSEDAFIAKYNSNGICQWAERISGMNFESVGFITIDSYQNLIVAGSFNSNNDTISFNNGITLINSGTNNGFLAKYNENGECQWATKIGGTNNDEMRSITVDTIGNIYCAGEFHSTTIYFNNGISLTKNGVSDGFISKYNTNGICQWATKIGGTSYNEIENITVDTIGNIFCVGDFNSSTINFNNSISLTKANDNFDDGFIAKYNNSGYCQWATRIFGNNDDDATTITLDNSGNIYISGFFVSDTLIFNDNVILPNFGNGSSFVAKYNENGECLWATQIYGNSDVSSVFIKIDLNNNLYVTGAFNSISCNFNNAISLTNYNSGLCDGFIAKYNGFGICQWASRLGGTSEDVVYSLDVDIYGFLYIAGIFASNPFNLNHEIILSNDDGTTDGFFAKYSCNDLLPPSIISPVNNEINVDSPTSFLWYSVSTAISYRIQVSTSSNFNRLLSNEIVTDTFFNLQNIRYYSSYYWRIKTMNNMDTTDWSQVFYFTIRDIPQPNLNFPENNSVNISLNSFFSWNYFTNISYYEIQFSNDSNFEFINFNNFIFDTLFYSSNLNLNTKYYWRVRTVTDYGSGDWSNIWNFTTTSSLPVPWTYVSNTGSYATIIVPTSIEPMMGSRQFMTGDAIGVFYSDSGILKCSGYGIWNGNDLGFTVWGDDTTTLLKDGLDVGENFIFKVWDGQIGVEYSAIVTYASGPTNFQVDGFTILGSLTVLSDTVTLPFNNGWNMISSWISPNNTNLVTLLTPIINDFLIIKNGSGDFYIPSFNINLIGSWNIFNGYQIYMTTADTLTFTGLKINPEFSPIAMVRGWNLKSYLRNSPMSVISALASISNDLLIVKDGSGSFYVPSLSINTIGNMQPGSGYQFYLNDLSATLTYPANGSGRIANFDEITPQAKLLKPIVENTGNNASLFIKFKNGFNGDEIGVYNSKDMLIGSGKIDNNVAGITIWGRNENSKETNGAYFGEKLSVKLLNQKNGILEELPLSNLQEITHFGNISDLTYIPDGIYFSNAAINNEISNELTLNVYPNPVVETYFVEFNSPESNTALLELYSLEGNLIWRKTINEANTYFNKLEFSVRGNVDGVYQLILKNGSQIATKRIIILK